MSIKAGKFDIDLWLSGYPIWATLTVDGDHQFQFLADDLDDLQHIAAKAIRKVAEHKEEEKRRLGR
jgi:hypothetical protein